MRKKAEIEFASLDVPVKNFGNSYVRSNYQLAIETCRTSKKYSIEAYKAAVKPVPEKYNNDIKDNNKEIFQ